MILMAEQYAGSGPLLPYMDSKLLLSHLYV